MILGWYYVLFGLFCIFVWFVFIHFRCFFWQIDVLKFVSFYSNKMQLSKLPVKSFSCKRFSNSIMGRELCIAELEVQAGKPLVLATSHLESPCPAPPKWDQMYSKERVDQAKEALNLLTKNPNVIFGGDMNWDEKSDGQFPLPDGWVDAWADLRPGENGWTYDTKSNQMLSGNRTLQKRLDRFMCRLHDFKISKIDMIGMEPIPGLSYCKEKKVRKEMQQLVLPVLPSDHYGLLLTISSQWLLFDIMWNCTEGRSRNDSHFGVIELLLYFKKYFMCIFV